MTASLASVNGLELPSLAWDSYSVDIKYALAYYKTRAGGVLPAASAVILYYIALWIWRYLAGGRTRTKSDSAAGTPATNKSPGFADENPHNFLLLAGLISHRPSGLS